VLTALALCVAAALAGVTGAWSPCGFSIVDTIGAGRRDGWRAVLAACATFTAGCLVGGGALFGGLALLGAALGTTGGERPGAAALALAAVAAVAELRGVRIRPQIRRQVPESWRRTMPLALATGFYGVLLGLGFTTFVLTLALAALAVLSLALGDPSLGTYMGLAFGAGRALPVVVLAPLGGTGAGARALELMAERPAALRGLRLADGLALGLVVASLSASPAWAAGRVIVDGTDPSVRTGAFAWQSPSQGGGVLFTGGQARRLPGANPALGLGVVAVTMNWGVVVLRQDNLQPVFQVIAPGADKVALSSNWLVFRWYPPGQRQELHAQALAGGPPRVVARAAPGSWLGRPDIDGERVAFHVAGRGGARIQVVNLRTGNRSTAVRSRANQLLNPSLVGRSLLYVRIGLCGQSLVLRHERNERVLLRDRAPAPADKGFEDGHTRQGSGTGPCAYRPATNRMLWTTALSRRFAYVTRLQPGPAGIPLSAILRLSL